MAREILEVMRAYASEMWLELMLFLPRLLSAVLLLIAGFALAALLRLVTRKLLGFLRFNALMQRMGTDVLLSRASLGPPDQLVAALTFWLTGTIVLLGSLRVLGIPAVDALLGELVHYVPKLASAGAIIVLGVFLSNFAWRATLLSAVNARVPAAKLVSALVRAVTLVAAIAMALEQLEIGQGVILVAFAIAFGAIMMALAIAFGLGGRHLARQYLERHLRRRPTERKPDEPGPSHL